MLIVVAFRTVSRFKQFRDNAGKQRGSAGERWSRWALDPVGGGVEAAEGVDAEAHDN